MYICRSNLCIDFQTLDDDKILDLQNENMRFIDWVFRRTTQSMSTILPPGTKYLVISKIVIQASNHMINDLQQEGQLNVPPSVGFFHHYRAKCVVLGNGFELMSVIDPKSGICLENPIQVDRTMYKCQEKLLKHINNVLVTGSQQCNWFYGSDSMYPNLFTLRMIVCKMVYVR